MYEYKNCVSAFIGVSFSYLQYNWLKNQPIKLERLRVSAIRGVQTVGSVLNRTEPIKPKIKNKKFYK